MAKEKCGDYCDDIEEIKRDGSGPFGGTFEDTSDRRYIVDLSEEIEKAREWAARRAQERKEREQGEGESPENPDRVVDSKIGETGDALRGVAGGVEEEEEGIE